MSDQKENDIEEIKREPVRRKNAPNFFGLRPVPIEDIFNQNFRKMVIDPSSVVDSGRIIKLPPDEPPKE